MARLLEIQIKSNVKVDVFAGLFENTILNLMRFRCSNADVLGVESIATLTSAVIQIQSESDFIFILISNDHLDESRRWRC